MPDLRAICNTANGLVQPVGGGTILTDLHTVATVAGFYFDAFAIMICRRMKRTTNGDLRPWRGIRKPADRSISVLKKMLRAEQLVIEKASLFSTSARRLVMQKGQPLH